MQATFGCFVGCALFYLTRSTAADESPSVPTVQEGVARGQMSPAPQHNCRSATLITTGMVKRLLFSTAVTRWLHKNLISQNYLKNDLVLCSPFRLLPPRTMNLILIVYLGRRARKRWCLKRSPSWSSLF